METEPLYKNLKVLVIEDDFPSHLLYAEFLKSLVGTVLISETGLDGINMYKEKDRSHSRDEVRYQAQVFRRRLHDRKQGPKAIRRATNGTPARPLTALTRDRIGPNGEPVGTVATDPAEVDQIAQRA